MTKRKQIVVDDPEIISKSQRKRDANELKSLALKLMGLSTSRFKQAPLDEQVREAIDEARQIRSNVARKRQMQYAAKLLRRIDATEIIEFIESFNSESRHITARQHRSEAWRDYLLESGDTALAQLLDQRHDIEAQAIRQLVRNAHRERKADKPPASFRALFQLLRDMDVTAPLPTLQV
jgi:ribosome-associated protein